MKLKRRHADNYEYALKVLDKYQDPMSDWEKVQVERANKIYRRWYWNIL